MYRRANQSFLMDPVAALKLLKLWVWIPPEIIQSCLTVDGKRHNLHKMSESRFKYRKEFWLPVMSGFNLGTVEANRKLSQDLCLHLFYMTKPLMDGSGWASGFMFDPLWYHEHKKMAFQFFQTLQTRKIERINTQWKWHSCGGGNERPLKLFEIYERMEPAPVKEKYEPEVVHDVPKAQVVGDWDVPNGHVVDMGWEEDPGVDPF